MHIYINFLFKIRIIYYSKSLRLGFLEGSLDKNPKTNKEIKKMTVVYTKIFKVNIFSSLKAISVIFTYNFISLYEFQHYFINKSISLFFSSDLYLNMRDVLNTKSFCTCFVLFLNILLFLWSLPSIIT